MKVDNDIFFAAVEERIETGQQVRITLVGTSMQPTLCEGDIVTLEPLAYSSTTAERRSPSPTVGEECIKVGDVVLFRYRGHHLLHRIVAVADGVYTTQGDNCVGTESCRRDDIVARMVAVERHHRLKHFVLRWFGHRGRKQLRPWYFGLLAVLMWAPLNGLGIPLDNYILGLRADHLLHASVYMLCPLFLWDLYGRCGVNGRKWAVWATAVAIGLLTEGGQYLLPYRGFDVNDLIANTLGVTLGWIAIQLVQRHLHRQR